MKALIDGDIVAYSCGFAAQRTHYSVQYEDGEGNAVEIDCEDGREANRTAKAIEGSQVSKTIVAEPMANALSNVNSLIERILNRTGSNEYEIYLTGKDNFRVELYPEYKANRDDAKPVHYNSIKKFLIHRWGAEVIDGQEADDAMSINQSEDTIICTKDKDLDMVPGLHYNWDKDTLYEVTEREGLECFYKQIITGDSTDNISGLYKYKRKRATEKLLSKIEELDTEKDMWDYVLSLFEGVSEEEIIRNAQLLWMRREEGEMWYPPRRVFINKYSHCSTEWEDTWECGCNDRCPVCGAEIEPYESTEIQEKSSEERNGQVSSSQEDGEQNSVQPKETGEVE